MKDICKRLNVDTKIYKERSLLAAISKAKDELVDPQEFLSVRLLPRILRNGNRQRSTESIRMHCGGIMHLILMI